MTDKESVDRLAIELYVRKHNISPGTTFAIEDMESWRNKARQSIASRQTNPTGMTDEELKELAMRLRRGDGPEPLYVDASLAPDVIEHLLLLHRGDGDDIWNLMQQRNAAVLRAEALEAENARLREIIETEIVQMALALRDDADEGRIKDDMGGLPWAFGFGCACNLIAKEVRRLAPRAALKGGKE